MRHVLVGGVLMGCSGFIGSRGLVLECPGTEAAPIGLDQTVASLDLAVRDLPMFAVSPARSTLEYGDGTSTGVSLRIEPERALLRAAQNPVLGDIEVARCEEVLTTYRVELFSDDGAFDWSGGGELVVEVPEDAASVTLAVPYAANLGDATAAIEPRIEAFLEAHPDLDPDSLVPVAYQLDLDVSDRAPQGTLALVLTHDPVPSAPRPVTEWVVGTF